jgi:prepilin-type N-terminal cleavage/methylation domain-containing protein
MKKMFFPYQRGFSLIEIMIVVIIMGILVSFAAGQFTNVSGDAKRAKLKADEDAVINAAREYFVLHGRSATSITDLKFSNTPKTPDGTPFFIEDPFITYEYPLKNKVYKLYRSTGRMVYIDSLGILNILPSPDSNGISTKKKPKAGTKPRLSPEGNLIAYEESGDKIVILDISNFDLEKPDTDTIDETTVKDPNGNDTKGNSPAWISSTAIVFTGKSDNPDDQVNYYVRSYDTESEEAPIDLFSIGTSTKPGPLHASSKAGIIAFMNNNSPSGIDIMTSSGDFINTIPATVKDDFFCLSADGSRIAVNKSGTIGICPIDIDIENDSVNMLDYTSGAQNPVLSPSGRIIAFEKDNAIRFDLQGRKSDQPANIGFNAIQGANGLDWIQ